MYDWKLKQHVNDGFDREFGRTRIDWSEGNPLVVCPKCGKKMEYTGHNPMIGLMEFVCVCGEKYQE